MSEYSITISFTGGGGGGSRGPKTCKFILKDLIEMNKMLKTP